MGGEPGPRRQPCDAPWISACEDVLWHAAPCWRNGSGCVPAGDWRRRAAGGRSPLRTGAAHPSRPSREQSSAVDRRSDVVRDAHRGTLPSVRRGPELVVPSGEAVAEPRIEHFAAQRPGAMRTRFGRQSRTTQHAIRLQRDHGARGVGRRAGDGGGQRRHHEITPDGIPDGIVRGYAGRVAHQRGDKPGEPLRMRRVTWAANGLRMRTSCDPLRLRWRRGANNGGEDRADDTQRRDDAVAGQFEGRGRHVVGKVGGLGVDDVGHGGILQSGGGRPHRCWSRQLQRLVGPYAARKRSNRSARKSRFGRNSTLRGRISFESATL